MMQKEKQTTKFRLLSAQTLREPSFPKIDDVIFTLDRTKYQSKLPLVAATVKRLFDLVIAALGLLVTAPLLVAVCILIKLDSPGPVLFFQRRIGLNQSPFILVKLRTMDENKRVTSFTRILRATGLDELPQLWNVLIGEMSIIGPRPEMVDKVEIYKREFIGYQYRHLLRPGITGWAQVNGLRGKTSISRRLRFDLEYVRKWSLLLDCRVLLLTFETIWMDTLRVLRK